MRFLPAFLLCVVALFASGCAFGTRRVNLSPVRSNAGTVQSSDLAVALLHFRDTRPEQAVGCVRNGFYIRTASVVADNDPIAWARECVRSCLADAGFAVRDSVTQENDTAIDGEVYKMFCDVGFSGLNATISMRLRACQGEHVLLQADYTGHKKQGSGFLTADDYRRALEGAMQDLLAKAGPDMRRLSAARQR